MSREFFDQVSDQLRGFLPPSMRGYTAHRSTRNLKICYPPEPREHYEVQFVGEVLEIGWHAEHGDAARNDDALAKLVAKQKAWRKALGKRAEAGPFLGRQAKVWRRLSEVWDGDRLDTPETALEAAERLAAYIMTIEPLRATGGTRRRPKP
jgi:hypothetical protein